MHIGPFHLEVQQVCRVLPNAPTELHAHRAPLPGEMVELAKPCGTRSQGCPVQRKCEDSGALLRAHEGESA